jgi:hypothetical protein
VATAQIEQGHFAVVRKPDSPLPSSELVDYRALESIPDLASTRAVSLDDRYSCCIGGSPALREWAGEHAAEIEQRRVQAFAVVNVAAFGARLREAFTTKGWKTEKHADEIKVLDGPLAERVNVSRAVVRMVLSRTDFAKAVEAVVEEIQRTFRRDAEFFARFRKHFRTLDPAVLDHYFVVYPEASCAALGWDYWQLSEGPSQAESAAFRQGIKEIETLLRDSSASWQGRLTAACARRLKEN